jgi:hypothetical protein
MIERDHAVNEAGADEAAAEDRAKAMAAWMAQQHENPLMSGGNNIFVTGGRPDGE